MAFRQKRRKVLNLFKAIIIKLLRFNDEITRAHFWARQIFECMYLCKIGLRNFEQGCILFRRESRRYFYRHHQYKRHFWRYRGGINSLLPHIFDRAHFLVRQTFC